MLQPDLAATKPEGMEMPFELGDNVWYWNGRTVETHHASSMRKLSVHSTAELVRYAIRCRLIELRKQERQQKTACRSDLARGREVQACP